MDAVAEPVKLTERDCCSESFSAAERECLILQHLPQVRLLARRIHGRLPETVSLDDLVSTGILGLIAAIDRFDPSRHVHLKTYAEHKIKGGILDSLRRLDWAPRQQRKHAKQIDAAIAVTEQRLQRSPTEQEVATELDLTVDRYHQWQVNVRGLNLGRLESTGPDDSGDRDLLRFVSGDPNEWPSALLERSELQRALASAISGIPELERTILSLYYNSELTLREIAKIVGLHESRISQIRAQAILRLRVCMTRLWPATERHPRVNDSVAAGKPPAASNQAPNTGAGAGENIPMLRSGLLAATSITLTSLRSRTTTTDTGRPRRPRR
jgi:RNA polymerase sigma factor for flagellar operon FliA